MTQDLLEGVGMVVELANNGAQAVAIARDNDYDTIQKGINMPVMDGIEATRQIRRFPNHARTPILALIANAFAGNKADCLTAGMNDFITKPVDAEQLNYVLLKWLNDTEGRYAN